MKKFSNQIMKKLLWVVGIAVAIGACDDPYEDSTYLNEENKDPLGMLMAKDSLATEWVEILRYSGMFSALNYAMDPFTAFVPTNEAVEAYYTQKGVSSIEELGKDFARSLVLMHTVSDSLKVDDIIAKSYLTNLMDERLLIGIDTLNAGEITLSDQAATSMVNVVEKEIPAYNGYAYRINKVLNPLVETVYDRIAQGGVSGDPNRYSIFAAALEEAGLKEQLSVVADTLKLQSSMIVSRRYYTALAVSDEAFQKVNINSVSDLKRVLAGDDVDKMVTIINSDGTEGTVTLGALMLESYLSYHVFSNSYDWNSLISPVSAVNDASEFTGDSTCLYDTYLIGAIMQLSRKGNVSNVQYVLNEQGTPAYLVAEQSNVMAKNGYVHEIDAWLPIWNPEQTAVTWDFAASASVKSIVEADPDGGLDVYQPKEPVSSEDIINLNGNGDFLYENTGVTPGKYFSISYVTCTKQWADAYNHDRVNFNLGYMGYISMETPTLVRGKYRVELDFLYNSLTQQFMKNMTNGSNGGLIKMTFDDAHEQMASPYTTIAETKNGVYSTVLYDEIEFEETGKHTFKFVIMDPAAATNKNFTLQFDCIRFIPITE